MEEGLKYLKCHKMKEILDSNMMIMERDGLRERKPNGIVINKLVDRRVNTKIKKVVLVKIKNTEIWVIRLELWHRLL